MVEIVQVHVLDCTNFYVSVHVRHSNILPTYSRAEGVGPRHSLEAKGRHARESSGLRRPAGVLSHSRACICRTESAGRAVGRE
jgi:hypothetical protein